jgi:hypothetical protein
MRIADRVMGNPQSAFSIEWRFAMSSFAVRDCWIGRQRIYGGNENRCSERD